MGFNYITFNSIADRFLGHDLNILGFFIAQRGMDRVRDNVHSATCDLIDK